jgi:hypothetical protein
VPRRRDANRQARHEHVEDFVPLRLRLQVIKIANGEADGGHGCPSPMFFAQGAFRVRRTRSVQWLNAGLNRGDHGPPATAVQDVRRGQKREQIRETAREGVGYTRVTLGQRFGEIRVDWTRSLVLALPGTGRDLGRLSSGMRPVCECCYAAQEAQTG